MPNVLHLSEAIVIQVQFYKFGKVVESFNLLDVIVAQAEILYASQVNVQNVNRGQKNSRSLIIMKRNRGLPQGSPCSLDSRWHLGVSDSGPAPVV